MKRILSGILAGLLTCLLLVPASAASRDTGRQVTLAEGVTYNEGSKTLQYSKIDLAFVNTSSTEGDTGTVITATKYHDGYKKWLAPKAYTYLVSGSAYPAGRGTFTANGSVISSGSHAGERHYTLTSFSKTETLYEVDTTLTYTDVYCTPHYTASSSYRPESLLLNGCAYRGVYLKGNQIVKYISTGTRIYNTKKIVPDNYFVYTYPAEYNPSFPFLALTFNRNDRYRSSYVSEGSILGTLGPSGETFAADIYRDRNPSTVGCYLNPTLATPRTGSSTSAQLYTSPNDPGFPATGSAYVRDGDNVYRYYNGQKEQTLRLIEVGQKVIDSTITLNHYEPVAAISSCDSTVSEAVLKNCVSSQTLRSALNSVFNGAVPVTINGGNYSGAPALQSGMITVNKGTLTDNSGTKSTYIVGEDSEASSTTSGNTTVTQVKLSNPPVTINWEDFPMPDLSAPVISVTRSPSNSKEPCTEVQLTVTAKDPDGNDSETPISIDGGAFQASPATYTVTENGTVDIVARDANGNTRNFSVNITNIDSEAPTVNGFSQSNTNWTKDPVRVTVNATDDVKLDDNPYKWSFTPNSTGVKETGNWTSEKSIKVNESGTLQVLVRDKLGQETLSDEYQVTNIDRIAPTATVNLSPDASHEASRDTGVRAELSFNNLTDPVTDLASPIADVGVLWDDSEGWTENTAKTFKENGVYYVKVRDSVGNISDPIQFTINNISTSLPVIDAFETTSMGAEYVQAPVDLKVTAHATGSSTLPARPYSWDGGKNWTSQSSLKITENGEYLVTVRDSVGNTAEASIVVNNIDPVAPTVGVYVYKGLPSDGSGTGPDDYVWKVRVEADDVGSGVDHVETLWDSGTHSTLPVIQDIEEPGIYGAIVYDKAGNKSYAEKVVTAESIGESAGTANGSYVDIKVPSSGSAGSYFNAAIQDLVYGPSGAYNKQTDSFKAYNGTPQIEAHVTASAKSSRYLTGYATFNSVKYPLDFGGGADGIAGGKNLPVTVTIPLSTITSDVKNGRLTVMLQEYDDSAKTTLVREGSATLYTSVQVNAPKLTYSYNAATDELLVNGSSAVAGIKAVGAKLDGGAMQTSFPLAVSSASSIEMVVQDKVMQETSVVVSLSDLKLNGSAGGILPTETLTDKSINSYMTTSRNGTTFIINGSQSNTDQIPAKELFEQIMA